MPIANENRLVVPDVLGTPAKTTRGQLEHVRSMVPTGDGQRDRCRGPALLGLFTRPAVMACFEIRRSQPELLVSPLALAALYYDQPGQVRHYAE